MGDGHWVMVELTLYIWYFTPGIPIQAPGESLMTIRGHGIALFSIQTKLTFTDFVVQRDTRLAVPYISTSVALIVQCGPAHSQPLS